MIVRGTGSIGRRHLRVLGGLSSTRVVACPVRDSRLGELRAEGFSAASVSDLPSKARGIVVATETSRHLADVETLLPLGDVLVEKPVAPTAKGLQGLARAAEHSHRRIFVAFCLRFRASLRAFADRLPELGRVDSVRIVCESYLPDWRPATDYRESYSARADEGGVLRDLSHELDYASWLFGRPREVFARVTHSGRLGIDADDGADLLWVSDGGCHVAIRLSYLSRVARRHMTAVGERGEITWDGIANRVTRTDETGRSDTSVFDEGGDAMYARQAAAFLRACDGGDPGVLATFDEGAFVTALADAARCSSQSGRTERILDWRTA